MDLIVFLFLFFLTYILVIDILYLKERFVSIRDYVKNELNKDVVFNIESAFFRSKNCLNNFLNNRIDYNDLYDCVLRNVYNSLVYYCMLEDVYSRRNLSINSEELKKLINNYDYLKDLYVKLVELLFRVKVYGGKDEGGRLKEEEDRRKELLDLDIENSLFNIMSLEFLSYDFKYGFLELKHSLKEIEELVDLIIKRKLNLE